MSAPIPDEVMSVTLRSLFDSPKGLIDQVVLFRSEPPSTYHPQGVALDVIYINTLRALERRQWVIEEARGSDPDHQFYVQLGLTEKGKSILEVAHA